MGQKFVSSASNVCKPTLGNSSQTKESNSLGYQGSAVAPGPQQDSATVDPEKVGSKGLLGQKPQEKCVLGGSTNSRSSEPAAQSPSEDKGSVGSQDGGVPGSKA